MFIAFGLDTKYLRNPSLGCGTWTWHVIFKKLQGVIKYYAYYEKKTANSKILNCAFLRDL